MHVRVLLRGGGEDRAQRLALHALRLDAQAALEVEDRDRLRGQPARTKRVAREAQDVDLHPNCPESTLAQHLVAELERAHAQGEGHRLFARAMPFEPHRPPAVLCLDARGGRVGRATSLGRCGEAQGDGLGLRGVTKLDGDGEVAGGLPFHVEDGEGRLGQPAHAEQRREPHLHTGMGMRRGTAAWDMGHAHTHRARVHACVHACGLWVRMPWSLVGAWVHTSQ